MSELTPTLDGLTVELVKAVQGVPVIEPADEQWLALIVPPVGQFAERQRVANKLTHEAALFAAALHCMRWFSRRSSVAGPAAFGPDAAAQIVQSDPDLALAYRMRRPRIG